MRFNFFPSKYYDLANKEHLQLAKWAPVGSGIVYILNNNIYYVSSPENAERPIQITRDGIPGIIYNGVPDWVYEGTKLCACTKENIVNYFLFSEEVLGSGSAVWFSPNGKRLAFAFFNDSHVPEYHYFIYGNPGALDSQYPDLITLKYPKVRYDR